MIAKLNTYSKVLIATFTLGVLLGACSNTFEFIERILEGPRVFFEGESTTKVDTIKTYFKTEPSRSDAYAFTLTPANEGELQHVTVTIVGGAPKLTANGVEVGEYFDAQLGDTVSMVLEPENIDTTYILSFASRSTTGQVTTRVSTLTLSVFRNLKPIASLKIEPTQAVVGEFTFDASGSKDQDTQFGGKIKSYTYTVTGTDTDYAQTFTTDTASIKYAFPSRGTFNVTLIVNDNDGGASNPVSVSVTF